MIRKGSIDHAFTVTYTTDANNQTSFCSFALRQVSILSELVLGRLRCTLAGVPPQPNSLPRNVPTNYSSIIVMISRLAEQWLMPECYIIDESPLYALSLSSFYNPKLESSSTGSSCPAEDHTRPFPSLWFREDLSRDSKNLINPFMHVQNYWTRHLATLKES